MSRAFVLVTLALSATFAAEACGGDKVIDNTNQPSGGASATPAAGGPASPPAGSASAKASASALPPPVFTESDFVESESSRDPFHSFERLFAPVQENKAVPQYTVILEKYSIDELKLVAIVSAADGQRAMFVDPQGKGWVVGRGIHIGRGEIVRIGASMSSYPLHWKIDKIKPDEVVLVREDSLHPEVTPTYREVPLHTESEKT